MAEKFKIIVNDQPLEVAADTYLLQVLQANRIFVPTLCYHKDLAPNGNCRLCVVEVEARGKRRLVTSCNYPVREEIRVWTESERVKQHRRVLAEMYLGRWPNVPLIRDVAKRCGVTDGSRFRSDLTDESPTACVLCTHCTRACEEFIQERVLDFAGRGILRHMTMPYGEVDPHCVGCTSCGYVCPTGAIEIVDDLNHPVNAQMIRDAGMKVNAEMARLDPEQCRMRQVGTANIIDVMDQYDLLPCHNYKFGSHPDAKKIYCDVFGQNYLTQHESDGCWFGCSMACAKAAEHFELKTGPYRGERVLVDGPEYETAAAAANMGCFDPDFVLEWNFYCDTYGIDTISFGTCMAFVMECFENGIITTAQTGGKELPFGATEAALECLHEMARGEGFGVDVGQGIRWLKDKWSREYGADRAFLDDIGMEAKGLEYSEYVSKESLAQQIGYTGAVKGPQHDEAWLIFMDMVNNQIPTFEDKAEALHYFPMFRTWFGLLGLCKLPWNDVEPEDNAETDEPAKVPGHVRGYWEYFAGMTGIELDEAKMVEMSERVYNFQRVFNIRMGKGVRKFDDIPYRSMGPVTVEEYESRVERYDGQLKEKVGIDPEGMSSEEKVAAMRAFRESEYEKLRDAVYKRRGWTNDAVPKVETLKRLEIDFDYVVDVVKDHPGADG